MKRIKSTLELECSEVNETANQGEKIQLAALPLFIPADLGDNTRKNWTCLTNEVNSLFIQSYGAMELIVLFTVFTLNIYCIYLISCKYLYCFSQVSRKLSYYSVVSCFRPLRSLTPVKHGMVPAAPAVE